MFVLLVCNWRPWLLFERAGFSTDFYDEQARSFLRGRLAVRPQVAGIEGFLIDGRTYLYYGPLLAIVRMPFALFGDVFTQRLTRVSMTIGFVVSCTGAFHLLEAARHRAFDRWHMPIARVASPWRTGAFVAAAACSPMLFMTGWVSVYHETELWAATFAVWAAVGVVRTVDSPSRRNAVMTAAFVAAAILTRAPVGLGAAVGAGLVALVRWRRDRIGSATVLAGCVGGFAVHTAINWAKFGSPSALPADRQVLSLQDPTRAAWFAGHHNTFFGLEFVKTTVVQYLRPDTVRFERLLPFVRYGPLAQDRSSYPLETITPSASLTTTATLLCVAAVIGLIMIVRRRDLLWSALIVGAAVGAIPTFTIGFIANRYLVDMMPVLLIPAAVGVATFTLPAAARWRRPARALVVAGIVWAVWCNGALATWTQNLKEPGFTEFRYRVDELFGNPAPSLVEIAPGMTVPRDGVVGLLVDHGVDQPSCEAVYIAEQGAWVNLERLDGAQQSTGTMTIAPDARTSIIGGDTWELSIDADSNMLRVVLDDNGVETRGDPIALPTGPVTVQVVNDDIIGQLVVNIADESDDDGQPAFFRFGSEPGPMLPSSDLTIDDTAPAETLCRRLEPRL